MPADIVCFGVIDWEFRWQRPQQMMSRLAAEGHRVFFVSPSRFLTTSRRPYELHPLREGVQEVRLRLPQAFPVYDEAIPPDLAWAAVEALAALQADEEITRAASFVQLASWAPAAYLARERFGWPIVYDCMDDWEHFEGVAPGLLDDERRLVSRADVVSVSSALLWNKWSPHARRPVLARNAADFDRFHAPGGEDPLPSVRPPVAGYIGAIASWFDVELVAGLARDHPGVSFVLVGDVIGASPEALSALPNVHLTGSKPYASMPSYLARFDVCLVPFLLNDATRAMDVVKLYEYASQGKPIVATALPELEPYRDLVYVARDRREFGRLFGRALFDKDPGLRERRIALARENTWAHRVAVIMEKLAEAETAAAAVRVARAALGEAMNEAPTPDVEARLERMVRDLATESGGDAAGALRRAALRLVTALHEREQAALALSRRLTQTQQVIGEQQEGLEFLKKTVASLEETRRQQQEGIEFLKVELAKAQEGLQELARIRGSLTWRVHERARRLVAPGREPEGR